MNSASSARIAFEPLRTIAFGGITNVYAAVGTAFANPVRLLKITNMTDVDIIVSYNGVTDQDIVIASGFTLYDYCTNQSSVGGLLEQPVGDGVWVKRAGAANPISGNVYVTVIYAAQR